MCVMVSYEPLLHRTAERELNELPRDDRNRLTQVLQDVAQTRAPTGHEKVRELSGQDGFFRVRVGDLRAIGTLDKPYIYILIVGYRKDVYENVDSALDNRLSGIRAKA